MTVTQMSTQLLTETAYATVTDVVTMPTIVQETYVTTQTIDSTNIQTMTTVRDVTSLVTATNVLTEQETQVLVFTFVQSADASFSSATVTQVDEVDNTQLSDCLNTVCADIDVCSIIFTTF